MGRCGRCARSLWDFLEADNLVFESNFIDLVYVKIYAQTVILLLSEEQENFWVGDLRALREERHLRLQSLENVGCNFGFV